MTKSKDIKNGSFASLEPNELLSNYNHDRNQQIILTRNFNEIDTPPARIEGAASGVGSSHKLYNNFSKEEVVKRQKQLKKDLEADWIRNSPLYNKNLKLGFHKKGNKTGSICPTCNEFFPLDDSLHLCREKVPQNASNEEIEAFNEVH